MNVAAPRAKWAHLSDGELRRAIDTYLTLGADQPHVPGRIAEIEDELERRSKS